MKTIMERRNFMLDSQLNHTEWADSSNTVDLQEFNKPVYSWANPSLDLDTRRKKIENTMKLIQNMIATDNDSRKKQLQENNSISMNNDTNETEQNKLIHNEDSEEDSPMLCHEKPQNDNDEINKNEEQSRANNDMKQSKIIKEAEVKTEMEDELCMELFLKDTAGVLRDGSNGNQIINSDKSYELAMEHFKNGCVRTDIYYECCFCDLLFANVKRYLIHYKWHTSSMSQAKQLAFIKSKTKRKPTNPQQQPDTNNKGSFTCNICFKSFKLMSRLRCHNNKCHSRTDEITCEMCHLGFKCAEELKSHIPEHDVPDGSGMFRCTTEGCDKIFKHKHSLTRHAFKHLEPTHICPHCSKKFCSPALLNAHVKRHTRSPEERKHACTFCDKSFYDKFTLTAHLRCHNNDRPFKCPNCSACYVTNSSLKRHIKISHGEKNPYSCNECGRTFSCEVMRSKHEAKMHGNPEIYTFQCKVCPYRFMTAQELRKHMYKTHKIKARS